MALLAAGILCLPLSACGEKRVTSEFFAMDTYMTVSACGKNAQEALEEAQQAIYALEAALSATRSGSELAMLNENGGGTVSEDTAALLTQALALAEETGGAFDPTVRPLMLAWGFTGEAYRLPGGEEIEALLPLCDFRQVTISGTTVTLGPGQQIDLGGIAKGWASQQVCRILSGHGVESAIVQLGGSVQLLGTKPDGSLWRTGIQNPDGSERHLGVIEGADIAIVTSGDYQRYFEEDGVRYHHILDPATGAPAESGLSSVTVVCADAAAADAYSTALYVMGAEAALNFWREHAEELDLVLYTREGKLLVTAGLAENFSSDFPYEVVS